MCWTVPAPRSERADRVTPRRLLGVFLPPIRRGGAAAVDLNGHRARALTAQGIRILTKAQAKAWACVDVDAVGRLAEYAEKGRFADSLSD